MVFRFFERLLLDAILFVQLFELVLEFPLLEFQFILKFLFALSDTSFMLLELLFEDRGQFFVFSLEKLVLLATEGQFLFQLHLQVHQVDPQLLVLALELLISRFLALQTISQGLQLMVLQVIRLLEPSLASYPCSPAKSKSLCLYRLSVSVALYF